MHSSCSIRVWAFSFCNERVQRTPLSYIMVPLPCISNLSATSEEGALTALKMNERYLSSQGCFRRNTNRSSAHWICFVTPYLFIWRDSFFAQSFPSLFQIRPFIRRKKVLNDSVGYSLVRIWLLLCQSTNCQLICQLGWLSVNRPIFFTIPLSQLIAKW